MASLTLLIATHNRAELLARVLDSLAGNPRPPGWKLQVLVVANACTDTTHQLLAARAQMAGWMHNPSLIWFAEPKAGKSHALNAAFPRIGGDWVAFVDDDHRIDAHWLTALTAAIASHPAADMFCGRVLPDWDGREPAWVHDDGPYRIYPLPIPRQDFGDQPCELTLDGPLPGGGNLVVRRDWLERIGPFRPELGPTGHDLGGAEDMEWLKRGLRLGARLFYVPDAIQYHYVDPARLRLPYLMRKAYLRSASVVAIEPGEARVPLYLYRKLAAYGLQALLSWRQTRRRYYLVRSAAALGEIAGHRQRGQVQLAQPSP
ncbi:MAG: glycosyltransferase [Burkholderiales bacterium]|nr:glycosyltransferase [Burkholderiales bacterium]